MPTYWDTSCILKLYCPEPDSARYLDLLEAEPDRPVSSAIMKSEFIYALHQKVLRKELSKVEATRLQTRFNSHLSREHLLLLPFGHDVQAEAARIAKICYQRRSPIPLRTLDGLHLATAVLAKCPTIITADDRMRSAAEVIGMNLG
jgi:predicted nucleic acid-binding protein